MTKPELYHPFIYRLLFKALQYYFLINDRKDIADLRGEPSSSDLDSWRAKVNHELSLARNTLLKLQGKPQDKHSKISEASLDTAAGFLLQHLPIPGIEAWMSEEVEKKKSTLPSGMIFRNWFENMEMADFVPTHFFKLEKSNSHSYYCDYSDREQRELDLRIYYAIEYNYLYRQRSKVDQDDLLRRYNNQASSIHQDSISLYYKKAGRLHEQTKETIRLGIFRLQDSILPQFYEPVFTARINCDIRLINEWSKGVELFLDDEIDVLLGSFPALLTALSNESKKGVKNRLPNFFWPLFSFSGYAIVTTRSYLDQHGIQDVNWEALRQGDVFKGTKVLAELGTDFEWAARYFLDQTLLLDGDYQLLDTPTNSGKQRLLDGEADIYCTNAVHLIDLISNSETEKEVVTLAFGQEDFNHQNFNGYITTQNFVNNHFEVFAELVTSWFNSINHFLEKVQRPYLTGRKIIAGRILSSGNRPRQSMIGDSLSSFINQQNGTNLTTENLMEMYRDFNEFFRTPLEALTAFVGDTHLESSSVRNVYQAIARTSKDWGEDEVTDEQIKEVLRKIKRYQ